MYEVNSKILNMLKISKWSPTTQTALENLIEDPMYRAIIKQYFSVIRNSVKDLKRNEIFDMDRLQDVEFALAKCYSTLAKYSAEGERLEKFCNKLYHNIDCKSSVDVILKDLEEGFSNFEGKSVIAKLGLKLTTNIIVEIYNVWLDAHTALCDFAKAVEEDLFKLHGEKWYRNVFNLSKITNKNEYVLEEPVDIIISFCDDLTKYSDSSQKMISACLYNTKSKTTFDNRSFGFLYRFSKDSIIAMSPSDTESALLQFTENDNLLHCLFRGTPLESAVSYYHASTIDLMTIYDYDVFKNKTYSYNEIMLKEGTKPYGMLIFREALQSEIKDDKDDSTESLILAQHGLQVITYCICNKLPLFVRESNGDLKYLPAERIKDIVCKAIDTKAIIEQLK